MRVWPLLLFIAGLMIFGLGLGLVIGLRSEALKDRGTEVTLANGETVTCHWPFVVKPLTECHAGDGSVRVIPGVSIIGYRTQRNANE